MNPHAAEQQRQKGNLSRFGTIAELDLAAARCRVKTGDLLSDWIPWFVPRAGTTIEWSAPAVGEQGMLVCPDGDTIGAVFLRGVYSDSFAAPDAGEHVHLVRFPDGTTVRYDDAGHALEVTLASGGTVTLTADGGVTINGDTTINGNVEINGDVQVNGKITASDDVVGGGISLMTHTHSGVQSGGAMTGPPA